MPSRRSSLAFLSNGDEAALKELLDLVRHLGILQVTANEKKDLIGASLKAIPLFIRQVHSPPHKGWLITGIYPAHFQQRFGFLQVPSNCSERYPFLLRPSLDRQGPRCLTRFLFILIDQNWRVPTTPCRSNFSEPQLCGWTHAVFPRVS